MKPSNALAYGETTETRRGRPWFCTLNDSSLLYPDLYPYLVDVTHAVARSSFLYQVRKRSDMMKMQALIITEWKKDCLTLCTSLTRFTSTASLNGRPSTVARIPRRRTLIQLQSLNRKLSA